jgi:hypothetical protein
MHTQQQLSYILEPGSAFTPDPDCPHCRNNPAYPHRHWTEAQRPAPVRRGEDNWFWRAVYRVWGNGGQ